MADEIFYLSIAELSAQIRAKKISPVELTRKYLERSTAIGSRLNAYAILLPEVAMAQAILAEKEIAGGQYRGPLHGIPYAAKDLLAVKGYPTTWGAKPYAKQIFDYDATVITKLRNAGAILIGKAAMIELAGGLGYRYASASASGAARNPWDENCWTCGSSSGSGAIASAGLAAFAIGTETWGSILCPASFCGVSGLRPTYGRVSRHGAMALSFSMDKIGVLARSANDCGVVLEAIAGHDPLDPASAHSAEFSYLRQTSKLRIGYLRSVWQKPPADIQSAAEKAVDQLRASGHSIEDAELPPGPWEAAAGTVIAVEGAAAFSSLIESGRVAELTDPLGRIGGYVNRQIPATDYMRALRIRAVLQKRMAPLWERFDVLTAASFPETATRLDTNLETDQTYPDPIGGIGNFIGLPAMSVPCGFDAKKLPIGLQFLARAGDEQKILDAANIFQKATDWHLRRPPVT